MIEIVCVLLTVVNVAAHVYCVKPKTQTFIQPNTNNNNNFNSRRSGGQVSFRNIPVYILVWVMPFARYIFEILSKALYDIAHAVV